MWRCVALALLITLDSGLLVIVQSCGHHLVHKHIRNLATRHVEQQAHMASSSWELTQTSQATEVELGIYKDVFVRRSGEDSSDPQPRHSTHGHRSDTSTTSASVTAEATVAEGLGHQRADTGGNDASKHLADVIGESGEGHLFLERHDAHNEGFAEGYQNEGTKEGAAEKGWSTDSRGRRLLQTSSPAPAPIRLSVTYRQLGSLDASQQQQLTRVVDAVRRILQKFINVKRPSSGGMLVDPYCNMKTWECYPDFISRLRNPDRVCGLATILPEHIINPFNCTRYSSWVAREDMLKSNFGPAAGAGGGMSAYGTNCLSYAGTRGEETDMYLYITAVQNEDCEAGAAAWARPCLFDLGNNRPQLGAANVCPGALRLLDEETLTAVLTHEMIHALGFTDSMYNLTRRDDGSVRPISEMVRVATVGDKQVQLLVSPRVRQAAQEQFGCPSLEGAQLEEEGSVGSAGSHWEYTHYQGEVMVASTIFATDGTPVALSNLTLSYLDDTGWYVTNRSATGLLSWGAGAGCQLPQMSCTDYMKAVPEQRLFCDPVARAKSGLSTNSFLCSSNYKSTGVCRKLNFTGGCGLVLASRAQQTCLGPDAANDRPEVFGWGTGSSNGRCLPVVYRFKATVGNSRYTYPDNGRDGDIDAACFETVCSADGKNAAVKMLGVTLDCPPGREINLAQQLPSRYDFGRIGSCPSAQALCATQSCPKSSCSSVGGSCLNGTCYCNLAYTGADCSLSLITGQSVTNTTTTDDASDGGTLGGGVSSPSPPPALLWTQVVQLTLSLNNSVSFVNGRLLQLRSVLASWAGLNVPAVVIKSVTDGALNGVSGNSAGNATISGRRRSLQQAASSLRPPPPAAGTYGVLAVVKVWLTTSNPQQLIASLQATQPQREVLISNLLSADFFVLPSGIIAEFMITPNMGDPPAPVLDTAFGPTTANPQNNRGRLLMMIALTIGGVAVVGIISAVVIVRVVRSRQSREHSRRHGRAAYVTTLTASNGFSNGAAAAAMGVTPPLSPHRDTHALSSKPFGDLGGAQQVSSSSAPQTSPESNAFSYYSYQAKALMPTSPGSHQPSGYLTGSQGQLAPLYSGPQGKSYG